MILCPDGIGHRAPSGWCRDTDLVDASEEEVPLAGGHDARPVRVGSTVRRPMKPWARTIHALLTHLENVGFSGAPRVLGIDDCGREILTYIPGEDGRTAHCYDDDALIAVGRLIRDFHDAVASFEPPAGASWHLQTGAPVGRLICHNDLSPANTIYQDGKPRAFIDWDLATPSTALWDLSYAARTFIPLYHPQDCEQFGYLPGQQPRRLRLFCDAYRMSRQTRQQLLPAIGHRLSTERSTFARRCEDTLTTSRNSWESAILD